MNNRGYRLVFSKLRGMLVAVAETATGHGKASQGETGLSPALRSITLFAMRHAAFAALALFGLVPVLADAQIVPSGAHAPNVISTANGLPQVNVSKPSGAGVSLNTYSQFDVGSGGAILNNSPVNTGTQLAGQIHGQFTNDELNYIDDLTIGSRYTVRGFSGQTMLAAEKGFYWRNELQYPLGQTGQILYAGLDYGHLWGQSASNLAGTQLAGAAIGLKGSIPMRLGAYSYDVFAGTPIYAPSGFPAPSITLGFQVTGQF